MRCDLHVSVSVTGLADPSALTQAVAAYQGCHFIGMPECEVSRRPHPLQVCSLLVSCPMVRVSQCPAISVTSETESEVPSFGTAIIV